MTTSPASFRRYLTMLILGACLAAMVCIPFAVLSGWTRIRAWPLGCTAAGYAPGWYLSVCGTAGYGDYSTGALYFGTDPSIMRAIKRADVVLIGTSLAEIAFSSQSLLSDLEKQGHRPYNLAVYGESEGYFRMLWAKADLKPKVVVVAATPFFDGDVQRAKAYGIRDGAGVSDLAMSAVEYWAKRWSQPLHEFLCQKHANSYIAKATCGNVLAQFRNRADGRVLHVNYPNANLPGNFLTVSRAPITTEDIERAKTFKQMLDARGSCMILTTLPPGGDRESTEGLAHTLGVPYAVAEAPNLRTIDGSHLTAQSAEAWGAAFAPELERAIASCPH